MSSHPAPATRALAAFASSLSYPDLPESTVVMSKKLLLDGLGCLVVGTRGAPGASAAKTVRRFGGAPQSTIFCGGFKGSVRDAAFANGITLYSVGLNDNYKPGAAHPGACIVPPLLAVGEWKDMTGRDAIAAMVAGYEVNGRIGRAISPSHRERGFHPTGTCGAFGATAAVGRMIGLDAEAMASAFGIAGSQAAGLYEFHYDGTLTMIFHAGRAAQNGVEAALLVQDGLSGPATILEGHRGFCHATTNGFDEESLTADLPGKDFLIEGTSFRPYFGCSSTTAASGVMEGILEKAGAKGSDVEHVLLRVHPVVSVDNNNPNPTTLLAARLSIQYNIALVMHHSQVLVADLGEDDLWNPQIREKMSAIGVEADEGVERYGATLVVTLRDGRSLEAGVEGPSGDPERTLSWGDVCRKFRRMTEPLIGAGAAEQAIRMVEGLEKARIGELVALVNQPPAGRA